MLGLAIFLATIVLLLLPVIALLVAMNAARQTRELARRVDALAESAWRAPATAQPTAPTAPASIPVPIAPPVPVPVAAPPPKPAAPAPVAAPVPAPAPAPTPRTSSLEERIGARWATWVGAILIVFATGFLLRYTFERNLIGYTGRVILGAATGVLMVVAAWILRSRSKLPYLPMGLAGGGLAILYLTLYAAFDFYHLIGATTAYALMLAVTAGGAAFAAATNQQPTAVLAVLGGLLTPVLLGAERHDENVLMGYLIVLDLLVLGVATYRSWPALHRLAFLGTVMLLTPGLVAHPEADHPVARILLLSGIFLVFLFVPLARAWRVGAATEPLDLVFVVANGAFNLAAVYVTLERWRPSLEGPWAFTIAALLLGVAILHRRRVAGDDETFAVHAGAAGTLVAIAFPMMGDGPWVTMAWAAQAVVLFFIAPRSKKRELALGGGVLLLALAGARAATLDAYWFPPVTPFWNLTTMVGFAVVAAFAISGALASRLRSLLWFGAIGLATAILGREIANPWDTLVFAALGTGLIAIAPALSSRLAPVWGGFGVLLLAAARAAAHAFASPHAAPRGTNATFLVALAVVSALAVSGILVKRVAEDDATIGIAPSTWRSRLWAVAIALLAILLWTEPRGAWPGLLLTAEMLGVAALARARRDETLRVMTVVIAAVVLARLYLADARAAVAAADTLVNSFAAARVLAALACALAGWMVADAPGALLSGLSWLELLSALSLGWFIYMDRKLGVTGDAALDAQAARTVRWQMQLGLSSLWAAFGGGSLALGFYWSRPMLRYAALGLLGITVAKVFLVDLSEVQTIWRVLSFLVLGLVLLGVSVLYQRRMK